MVASFKRICLIGTVPAYTLRGKPCQARVYLTIRWDGENGNLSICGVEGPTKNGDAYGSCGQIVDTLHNPELTPSDQWDAQSVAQLADIWERWHLNDMRAGTPAQMEIIRKLVKTTRADYDEQCQHLASVDLLIDNGYRYGSRWLHEDVPYDVIRWLEALPESPIPHPWGD